MPGPRLWGLRSRPGPRTPVHEDHDWTNQLHAATLHSSVGSGTAALDGISAERNLRPRAPAATFCCLEGPMQQHASFHTTGMLLLSFGVLTLPIQVLAATYYVDVGGNDASSGDALAQPFRTPEKAESASSAG